MWVFLQVVYSLPRSPLPVRPSEMANTCVTLRPLMILVKSSCDVIDANMWSQVAWWLLLMAKICKFWWLNKQLLQINNSNKPIFWCRAYHKSLYELGFVYSASQFRLSSVFVPSLVLTFRFFLGAVRDCADNPGHITLRHRLCAVAQMQIPLVSSKFLLLNLLSVNENCSR